MLMKTKFALFPALAGLALMAAGLCHADDEQLDTVTKARVDPFVKGSATIDVSQYPTGIQENYKVFSRKCSQCHNLWPAHQFRLCAAGRMVPLHPAHEMPVRIGHQFIRGEETL
jgi:hypothetical protein